MSIKLIKNALSSGAGFVCQAIIAFLLTPFIIHSLGNTAYGVWVLVVALTGYLGLLDLGVRSTFPKYISQYHAKHDIEGLNRFINTILSLCLVLGLIALIFTLLGATLINHFFIVDAPLQSKLPVLVLIVGVNLALAFPLTVFQGVLYGLQQYVLVNTIHIAGVIIRSALIYILLKEGYGIMTLALVTILSSLIISVIFMAIAFRRAPEMKLKMLSWDRDELKKITGFSASSFMINVADQLIYYGATVIVGIFLSVSAVTFFAIAESLVLYMRQGVLSLVTVLTPAASEMYANNDIDRLHTLTIMSTRTILLLILPMGVAALIIGPYFIQIWMGAGYEKSSMILSILVVSQTLALSQYGPELILYGINKHKALAILMMAISFINIILSIILVQFWGLAGVALGCAIPLAFGQAVFVPIFIKRYIGLSIPRYLRAAVLPALPSCFVFTISLWAATYILVPDTWFKLATVAAISTILYLPAIIFLTFNKEERAKLWAAGLAYVPIKTR